MPFLLATESEASLGELMKKVVLPDDVSFLGLQVNPSFYSALFVTSLVLLVSLILRIFFIPRMKKIPGKGQIVLEKAVGFFAGLAGSNSPHNNRFLGAYIFSAAIYVFIGTMVELLGLRAVLVDINACLAIALCSFGTILAGGVKANGPKGALHALKDFSLPISMAFRLFGSMLSGLIVTDLVYHFLALSFVLPVFVAVIFTVFHAVVQTYVLSLLTSMFYGTASEIHEEKPKKQKKNPSQKVQKLKITQANTEIQSIK